MTDHDVIIVGAGPVGMLLACLLAQNGVDVAVYEQRTGADERTRAIGIHPPGRRALDAIGIGDMVRSEALELDGGEVLCRGRVVAAVSFSQQQRVLILPQGRTSALLRARLEALHPGALRAGTTVRSIRDAGDAVRVTVDARGGRRELTARIVVAADGVHSETRSALGLAWRPAAGEGSYVMMDIPDADAGTRAQLHCERAGLVESFPLPAGRRRWVLLDRKRTVQDVVGFASEITRRTGIHLEVDADAVPTAFLASQHRADRAAVGRIALLGDAAHETSPIGGQGMNLGWIAARRLAEQIGSGVDDFTGYSRETLRAAARAQHRAAFYMAMGNPLHAPLLPLRNAMIGVLGMPMLRRRTADLITMRGI